MIAILDCNNFYASCEKSFDPSIRQLPTIVLSNNDGCVIARSKKAKSLGIKMGQPFFEIQDIVPENNIQVYSSNYNLYADVSDRIMNHIKSRFRNVEVYSIDEAFFECDGFDYKELMAFRSEIWNLYRIPVSIGVGPTKTLAKLMNKKAKKNNGVTMLHEISIDELRSTELEDVWGLGRKLCGRFQKMGIVDVGGFMDADVNYIQKTSSVTGLRTWMELHGNKIFNVSESKKSPKMVTCSRTFGKETKNMSDCLEALFTFLNHAVDKLKKGKQRTSKMFFFLSTDRFKEDYKVLGFEHTFNQSTDEFSIMWNAIRTKMTQEYRSAYWKKAGVRLYDLSTSDCQQLSFFEDEKNNENSITGSGQWQLKRQYLSPSYTNSWEDLPIVS